MVKILLTLLFANSLIAHDSNEHHADGGIHHSPTTSEFNENPTAPYDYFANFEGAIGHQFLGAKHLSFTDADL